MCSGRFRGFVSLDQWDRKTIDPCWQSYSSFALRMAPTGRVTAFGQVRYTFDRGNENW